MQRTIPATAIWMILAALAASRAKSDEPAVCHARAVSDGPRHDLVVDDPPVAKSKAPRIDPEGKGTSDYVYAAIAQARGAAYREHQMVGGVPAPLVALIEAKAARGDARWCLDTIHEYQQEAAKFDAAWTAYTARRQEVERAIAAAAQAAPKAAVRILTAVITPTPVAPDGHVADRQRAPLEPIDAETDALLALIPAATAGKDFALLGDVARGLYVRRRATADEHEERMLWLVAREPETLRAWADTAAGVTHRQEYVQAMNLASDRLRAARDFGLEMAWGIAQHRAALGLKYGDLLDTNSAKPGDLVVIHLNEQVQVGDRSVVLDLRNSWQQPYDCQATEQICGWDWDGGRYHASFCERCQYRKVDAHLAATFALSAPPPGWARAGRGATIIARLVSARKNGPTEAIWSFVDAQILDDRFVSALRSPSPR